MSRIVPAHWMPSANVKRVILHWTAGGGHASAIDREHYHILVERDGRLVRGEHSIADNDRTGDGDYAAHTRGVNTNSAAVSFCAMAGAIETPFRPGTAPLTREQVEVGAMVCADLCERYRLQVLPETVLGHCEVEKTLGIRQAGKWDPWRYPWQPGTAPSANAVEFRARVHQLLSGKQDAQVLAPVRVVIDGREVTDEGVILNGTTWLPLRPLAEARQWTVATFSDRASVILSPERRISLEGTVRGDRGFVQLGEVCQMVGWPKPVWDPKTRTATVRTK